jgi:hypothetical protein
MMGRKLFLPILKEIGMDMSIVQKKKTPEIASIEVCDIFREMCKICSDPSRVLTGTENPAAILTLAAIINMNAHPIYIVEEPNLLGDPHLWNKGNNL